MSESNETSLDRAIKADKRLRAYKKQEARHKTTLQAKTSKKKRKPKQGRRRRRDWYPEYDTEELEYAPEERIMPRGEHERRRNLEQAPFTEPAPETPPTEEPSPMAEDLITGIVVAVQRGLCQVSVGEAVLACYVRGNLQTEESHYTNLLAVGDEVLVEKVASGDEAEQGVVVQRLPRRSVLTRPDVTRPPKQQVIVANVDQLLIVSAWREPHLWFELIDRYLITASRNQLPALICLNKVDLAEDIAACESAMAPYRQLEYEVILTSASHKTGLKQLRDHLQKKTTVLAGLSGVGKSSLLTAINPAWQLRIGEISAVHGEGRHTTTQATRLQLDAETAVVDTPGIRELGVSGLYRHELDRHFPELAQHAAGCRFNNCSHLTEPECAVQAALEAEQIAPTRYHSYQQIYEQLPA